MPTIFTQINRAGKHFDAMKKITKAQLKKILANHAKWLANSSIGSRANLSWANLSGADLSKTSLREANLSLASLSRADLSGANLDFGQWPLWCGSLEAKIDEHIARQLVYHALAVSKTWFKPTKKQLGWVNKFHRISEVPKLL